MTTPMGLIGAVVLTMIFTGCTSLSTASLSTGGLQTLADGHQRDGTVVLSSWQHNLSCPRLKDAIWRRIAQMASLARAERNARNGLPPTVLSAISWSTGSHFAESSNIKRHRWLRAEMDAYHAAMLAKNCPPFALDALYRTAAMPQSGGTEAAPSRPAAQAQAMSWRSHQAARP